MIFDLSKWIMNPFVLMFLTVLSGMIFGKVKFKKINLGVSGTLFTGLLIGWGVVKYAKSNLKGNDLFEFSQSFLNEGVIPEYFFSLFLILFITTVGLLAAKDIVIVLKKHGMKFIFLGLLITFVGAITTYAMINFSTKVLNVESNIYEITGVYTGALTSSPGLASATETGREHAVNIISEYDFMNDKEKEEILKIIDKDLNLENNQILSKEQEMDFIKNVEASVGVGYAISYPFGVMIVILSVNFIPIVFNIDVEKEKIIFKKEMQEARELGKKKDIEETPFDLIAFCIAMIFGYSIGKIGINLKFIGINQIFSLGSTGGVLIGTLILGSIGKIGNINFRMNSKMLVIIKELSLAFFLAIVGLRYGFKMFESIFNSGYVLALVGFFVGFISIMVGFLVGRYIFKINWVMLSGAICGGMTSTPGLGATIDAIESDDPATGYGATYPIALFGMVFFTIILHMLPI